ncbi:MAG: AI-2E family transporter [Planctomycetaceae bacterium]|nr:AI-2E family transporter [Planctomycetaceae bacterium]
MSRWASFFVLVGVLIVIAAFFVRVMAEFLVPLFVALVLVVIFRPLHVWVASRVPQRPALAAFITTGLVSMLVFLPFAVMIVMAAAESRELVKRFDRAVLQQKLEDFRDSVGLNFPHADRLVELEEQLLDLRDGLEVAGQRVGSSRADLMDADEREMIHNALGEIEVSSRALGEINSWNWPILPPPPLEQADTDSDQELKAEGEHSSGVVVNDSATKEQESGATAIQELELQTGSSVLEQHWFNYVYQLQEVQRLLKDRRWEESAAKNRSLQLQLVAGIANSHGLFREFKVRLLGGPAMAWLKETVHPQKEDVEQYSKAIFDFAKQNFVSWGSLVSLHVGRLIFGSVIVVVALYFFLLDGPAMIEAFMQISPMDRRHEAELIAQFDRTSRAVVVASLAAAIAQGLLAGLGFYFAGVQSVFLLTMLTILLSMVPFLGAASVWVPVVLYVGFLENQPWTAFFLFLYSAIVVSMSDNVIKPYILHGQSNLHPLLALLSVLGGVAALGPIGIMLGPMLVVFLQTILKMLKQELLSMEQNRANPGVSHSKSSTLSESS